jgi:putative ABC transport system substrate-binding protein
MRCKSLRILLSLALSIFVALCAVVATPQAKLPRIGYLSPGASEPSSILDSFRQGLRELGYVEGQTIALEPRFADGRVERLPALAAELARLQVDVIVTWGPAIHIAMQATRTIPIVMVSTLDAVETGLVASLARPGGNVTGSTLLSTDLMGKRLELLKETLPGISRLVFLTGPPNRGTALLVEAAQVGAQALGLQLHVLEVRHPDPDDILSAFAAMARERAEALYVMESPVLQAQRLQIIDLAVRHRLPTLFGVRGFVDAGGLMSYGARTADLHRRAAVYVDKILKGAKPADLPVEQPTRFEFVLNRKTAQVLGLTIPPIILLRADEVIE